MKTLGKAVPRPRLKDDHLYSTDNGRIVCGACAGASARFTGRDISGKRVITLNAADAAAWLAEIGEPVSCEACAKQMPKAP